MQRTTGLVGMTKWRKIDRLQTSRHWEVRQYETPRFARMEHRHRDLLYMVYQRQWDRTGVEYLMIYYRFKSSVSYAGVHNMVGSGTRCDIEVSLDPNMSRLRCMDDSFDTKWIEIGTFDKSLARTMCRMSSQSNTLKNYYC